MSPGKFNNNINKWPVNTINYHSYLIFSGECQYQLETDYIQRYLGELTLMQESSLIQLRKSIADLQKGKVAIWD